MKSGIYQILNTVNGKSYIGSAINLQDRWRKHRYKCRNNKHENDYFQKAWNKYGESVFQFNVLEYVQNPEWLIEIEQYWIDFMETTNEDFGYNICSIAGSRLGVQHTEQSKQKMSEANKGNQYAIGHKVSVTAKKKISETHRGNKRWLGRKHSNETKIKMKETNKGKSPWRGKKHTEESKKKMSESAKKRSNKTPLEMKPPTFSEIEHADNRK
jgi:hypothetical protein